MIGGGSRWSQRAIQVRCRRHCCGQRHGRWREDLWKTELGIGCDCCIDGQFTLGQEALEVTQHATTQWVLCIDPFDAPEVAGNFRHALPETHDAIIEKGTGVPIGRIRIHESCVGERKGRKGREGMRLQAHYPTITPVSCIVRG